MSVGFVEFHNFDIGKQTVDHPFLVNKVINYNGEGPADTRAAGKQGFCSLALKVTGGRPDHTVPGRQLLVDL